MSNQALSHFILYLRPFALERKFRFRRSLPFSAGALIEPGTASFELLLYAAVETADVPIIALGNGGVIGARRVPAPDELWRQRFRILAERARTIIFVPGKQPGVLDELHWLRVTGLLGNTVFFKPWGYPREEWEDVCRIYEEEEDVMLPEYSKHQLTFGMYASGRYYDVNVWKRVYIRKKQGEKQMRKLLLDKSIHEDK